MAAVRAAPYCRRHSVVPCTLPQASLIPPSSPLPQEFDPSPQGQGCTVTMGDFVRDIMLDQVGAARCARPCTCPRALAWVLQTSWEQLDIPCQRLAAVVSAVVNSGAAPFKPASCRCFCMH